MKEPTDTELRREMADLSELLLRAGVPESTRTKHYRRILAILAELSSRQSED